MNVVYRTAKLCYATLGGLTGGLAFALTAGDLKTAETVWVTTMGGTYVVFFFQAEGGIRDLTVTGVQTCALPIWRTARRSPENYDHRRALPAHGQENRRNRKARQAPQEQSQGRIGPLAGLQPGPSSCSLQQPALPAHTDQPQIGFITLILHGLLRRCSNRLFARILWQFAIAPNHLFPIHNANQPFGLVCVPGYFHLIGTHSHLPLPLCILTYTPHLARVAQPAKLAPGSLARP